MPKWLKTSLKILGLLIVLLLVVLISLTLYVNTHKAKVLALINTELKKNVDGQIVIGDMSSSFFTSFPGYSLILKNVLIRDKRFAEHKHTLLNAKTLDVSVNTAALLHGTLSVSHIDISDADIDLFTDSTGYSNASVFKKSDKKKADDKNGSSASAELGKFNLSNVNLSIDNRKAKKLFKFDVHKLNGEMNFPDSGWNGKIHLDVMSRSLGFNMQKGAFLKDKAIEADMTAGYNEKSGKINVASDNLSISGDVFKLRALFSPDGSSRKFSFHLVSDGIAWKSASSIVAANISKTLYKFGFEKPIPLDARISGSFGGGDPLLYITSVIQNNKLIIPGAEITNCNFNVLFTNQVDKAKPLGDPNSVIKLTKFTGTYKNLPIRIDTGSIINLETPIATGNFVSKFSLTNLNDITGRVVRFTSGSAALNLRYKADIINLRLNKPVVAGDIAFKNADMVYVPENLHLKNTSLAMHFIKNDLVLNNIRLQSGRSIVLMNGHVNNFLNLYYNAPEKIIVDWQINSPQMYLAEFMGFLSGHKKASVKAASRGNSGNVIDQLSNVVDRAQADMHMHVANVHYKKFLAKDMNAELLMSEDGIIIKSINLKHADGSLLIKGNLIKSDVSNRFAINTVVNNVDVREFFESFDNFGLQSPTYQNLKGHLSASTNINGVMKSDGSIVKNSINGKVGISLVNGALIDFGVLKSVGKYAFPFRRMGYITIPRLDAVFDIKGSDIVINPIKLSSSAINADIAGTYDMKGKNTDIKFDVPLRNPKNDSTITDNAERLKKRYKGIVLHLAARNNETGGIKVGFQ
ncbi:AsmA family protein [Mucilaginibacter ginkgonis]|uniref:AsmA family protein n=1 Tax=Mucilaginibacter ginkgonis TaxID=2682091 RepID=A0A6I4HVI6_9SPHI|nr:AsmA family protein [Mucilaginibacter ginkgonis]QQL50945.1 AsmA family protein [Mucilaginibacter ginkgonis]